MHYDVIKSEGSSITCDKRYFLLNTFLNYKGKLFKFTLLVGQLLPLNCD